MKPFHLNGIGYASRLILPVVAFIAFRCLSFAATTGNEVMECYSVVPDKSTLKIIGTSTWHDWVMVQRHLVCHGVITKDARNELSLKSFTFRANVKGLKSDYLLMDKITYRAMNAEKYPEITFDILSSKKIMATDEVGKGLITGYLTVSGVRREISVPVDVRKLSDNLVKITGSVPLKMTNFGIVPPTVFLGLLKTGDDIQIAFSMTFNKQ